MNLPHTTVQYIIQKFKPSSEDNKKHTGRKHKLTESESRDMVRKAAKNPGLPARMIVEHIATSYGKFVTPQKVRNRLHEAGYKDRVARKKPFI